MEETRSNARRGERALLDRTIVKIATEQSRLSRVRRQAEQDYWGSTHLELRFYGTPSVRKQGFDLVTDLMEINPRLLFQRHIKLIEFVPEALKKSQARAYIKRDRAFYRGKETSTFIDKYRASIPRRVRSLIQRQCQDRVQQVKSIYPDHVKRLESISIDVLNLPDRLSWPL
jgi:hypothetical protein